MISKKMHTHIGPNGGIISLHKPSFLCMPVLLIEINPFFSEVVTVWGWGSPGCRRSDVFMFEIGDGTCGRKFEVRNISNFFSNSESHNLFVRPFEPPSLSSAYSQFRSFSRAFYPILLRVSELRVSRRV
jgi:hypothetical protein